MSPFPRTLVLLLVGAPCAAAPLAAQAAPFTFRVPVELRQISATRPSFMLTCSVALPDAKDVAGITPRIPLAPDGSYSGVVTVPATMWKIGVTEADFLRAESYRCELLLCPAAANAECAAPTSKSADASLWPRPDTRFNAVATGSFAAR